MFRIKEEHDGSKRYNARLVVKGFQKKSGIDYNEIFSSVVKMNTIKLVLSILVVENLQLEQLDVKTTFLHSTTRGFPSGHDSIAIQPTNKNEGVVEQVGV